MRFQRKGGFKDGTLYLESRGSDIWLIHKTKQPRIVRDYDLDYCEDMVERGIWEKIEARFHA